MKRRELMSGAAALLYLQDGKLPLSGNVTTTPVATLPNPPTTPATTQPPATPPSTIALGLMAHANDTLPMHASWPGFARGQMTASASLVGSVNGQTFPIQQDSESHWSDGSVRAARISFRLPVNLTAGVETIVTVTPTAAPPNRTALITPQALVAAKDITLKTYGLDMGSLTYVTSLRDIVTNLPRDTWGTNPLGGWDVPVSGPFEVMIRGWRYRKDSASGASHAWIRDTIYLSYRIDGTYEVIASSIQGNWDGPVAGATLGGTTQTRGCCFAELYDGTTLLRAWGGPNDARVTTIAASTFNVSTNQVTLPASFGAYTAVTFTPAAGGTLPSGLNTGVPYWLGGGYLNATRAGATLSQGGSANAVTLGTAGSGNIIVTPAVHTFYGTGLMLAGADALPIRIGGSRVDTGVKWDKTYLSKWAKLFPAYDPTITLYSGQQCGIVASAAQFYPNQMPWGPWLNTTGDNPGDNRIGFLNQNSLLAYLQPYDSDLAQTMRHDALGWGDQPIWWVDTKSGRTIVSDNGPDDAGGTYPQMGASRPTAAFNGGADGWLKNDGRGGGGTATNPDFSGYFDGYSSAMLEASHMPCPWAMAVHMTGHPIYADMGVPHATAAQMYCVPGDRNPTIAGKTYYNVLAIDDQPRAGGWLLRTWGFAETFSATARPETAYLKHSMDSNAAWGTAYVASNPPHLALGMIYPNQLQPSYGQTAGSQYFNTIFCLALAFEMWRGDRPAWLPYLQGIANLTVGVANDASPTGGSGYVISDGYTVVPFINGNTPPDFATIRDMVAGNYHYGNLKPPFPATGFAPQANSPTQPDPFVSQPGGFPTGATAYQLIERAFLAVAKDIGLVSLNGDNSSAVYDLLNTRFNTAPCTGIIYSGPVSGSFGGGIKMFPAWGIVPALS